MRVRGSFFLAGLEGGACAIALQSRRMPAWRLAVCVATAAIPLVAHAAVYKCKKMDGTTAYSDVPCESGAQSQAIQSHSSQGNVAGPRVSAGNQTADQKFASACWLAKYREWRTKNPELGASGVLSSQTAQSFQRECHSTVFTTTTPAVSAINPASQAAMKAEADRLWVDHQLRERPRAQQVWGGMTGTAAARPASYATAASAAIANGGRAQ
jgi:hypothetical protein